MTNFANLFKKEVKELFTKQTMVALLFTVILYGMMGNFIGSSKEEIEESISQQGTNIGVLDLDQSEKSQVILSKLIEQGTIRPQLIKEKDIGKAIDETKEKKASALLVIPAGFGKNIEKKQKTNLEIYSLIEGLSVKDTALSQNSLAIIEALNQEITTNLIKEAFPDDDPKNIIGPIEAKEFVVVNNKVAPGSPLAVQSLTTTYSLTIPFILMILIIYAGTTIMTSMGLEKENKTLETLLTLPIKRIWIVFAKMAGAALVALVMAVVVIGGFRYYLSSTADVSAESSLTLENFGLAMSTGDYLLLGLSLFLAILVALSLCLILGMLSQDIKSAQTMNFPIILLVMIPYFLLTFQDVKTLSLPMKIILYAIPFSHPFIASQALIFHHRSLVVGGIIYLTVLASFLLYIAVRLFNTDKVLTAKLSLKKAKNKLAEVNKNL